MVHVRFLEKDKHYKYNFKNNNSLQTFEKYIKFISKNTSSIYLKIPDPFRRIFEIRHIKYLNISSFNFWNQFLSLFAFQFCNIKNKIQFPRLSKCNTKTKNLDMFSIAQVEEGGGHEGGVKSFHK